MRSCCPSCYTGQHVDASRHPRPRPGRCRIPIRKPRPLPRHVIIRQANLRAAFGAPETPHARAFRFARQAAYPSAFTYLLSQTHYVMFPSPATHWDNRYPTLELTLILPSLSTVCPHRRASRLHVSSCLGPLALRRPVCPRQRSHRRPAAPFESSGKSRFDAAGKMNPASDVSLVLPSPVNLRVV